MLDDATQQQDTEAQPAEERGGGGRSRRQRGGGDTAAAVADSAEAPPAPRLKEQFRNEIIPQMMREFDYSNPMEVPRLQKIVLNVGLGEALVNGRALEAATQDLTTISGQKPVTTRAPQVHRRVQNPAGQCHWSGCYPPGRPDCTTSWTAW